MNSFHGTAEITDEGIKKHFKTLEPHESIFELVWNGFDANASSVAINTNFNSMQGLETVEVLDNGDGIDLKNLSNSFEKFNESTKKNDDDKHGSQGKGRLAFHKLCGAASWYTKRDGQDAKIDINSAAIKSYVGDYLSDDEQHALLSELDSGTCVVLRQFVENKLPSDKDLMEKLSKEFGWYLALNSNRKISLNGNIINVPRHEVHKKVFVIDDHHFTVKVIRWDDKPSSEKSFNYLIGRNSRVIVKELSKANNKVTFYTSAYASSDWLDGYNPEIMCLDPNFKDQEKILRDLLGEMTLFQREIYKSYLRDFVDRELDRFENSGYFPTYTGIDKSYAEWRRSNTRQIVKELYLADPQIFNKLSPKPAKILIRLLDKILVSNENDTLLDVLDGVLDLKAESLDSLASLLKSTTLENIISTIELLQKRQQAIHELKEVMNNRYSEVLETPDLQKIIENNTWLFGAQYATLGAEEDTFTTIARNLRSEIKDINLVSLGEIEDATKIDGINRQVDLFLARKVPSFDSIGSQIFKCVIVEIKRPGISLNKKHLQQIDDYSEIVSRHPAFNSAKMHFEIILIGRKISKDDFQIRQRMNSLRSKSEFGLVTDNEKIKCYVKDWFTIFDEFELSNNYLLGTLKTKLEDLSERNTKELIQKLQSP